MKQQLINWQSVIIGIVIAVIGVILLLNGVITKWEAIALGLWAVDRFQLGVAKNLKKS